MVLLNGLWMDYKWFVNVSQMVCEWFNGLWMVYKWFVNFCKSDTVGKWFVNGLQTVCGMGPQMDSS